MLLLCSSISKSTEMSICYSCCKKVSIVEQVEKNLFCSWQKSYVLGVHSPVLQWPTRVTAHIHYIHSKHSFSDKLSLIFMANTPSHSRHTFFHIQCKPFLTFTAHNVSNIHITLSFIFMANVLSHAQNRPGEHQTKLP